MLLTLTRAALAALFVFALAPTPADALKLQSVKVEESARLQQVRPDWPVPKDPGQIFYMQRSTNPNTVVYRVNFDSSGNIDARNPGGVYWRRFNYGGEAKNLKQIEHLAFGFKVRKGQNAGEYIATLRQLPQIPMLVRQTGPNQVEVWTRIGGKTVRPVYAFLEVSGSGLGQKITGFSLHGIDPSTGRAISETFAVSGGAIRP